MERKLTAVLCADVHGYSRLMGEDEEATFRTLASHRKIIDALIEQHHGRFVNSAGDSVVAEFASVVNAVQCGIEFQAALKTENANLAPERRMEFRIGVNLGDVIVEGEQIYGDGVNVAARLESLADPGGICISGTVHEQVRDKLALGYKDLGDQEVKNIARPVRVYRVLSEGDTGGPRTTPRVAQKYVRGGALSIAGIAIIVGTFILVQHLSLKPPRTHASIPPPPSPALALPDKPSIAVLPLTNMSRDHEQEYFSDGITDDLITDLSKIPGLFVIDRNSSFAYKGRSITAQAIGRQLGVKYVLEGSARKDVERARINIQLVDATKGDQVWGQRYDKPMRDIFSLQDEVVKSVIATLNVQLPLLEKGIVVPQRTTSLEAYDYFLRGLEHFSTLTQGGLLEARKMFEKAIALDPNYADVFGVMSFSYFLGYVWEWDGDAAAEESKKMAERAIALDDSNANAYALLGWIAALRGQFDTAITQGKRAVALDHNSAFAEMALANIFTHAGEAEQGLAHAQTAMRLDPLHPEGYWNQVGFAYNAMGRYAEAVSALKAGVQNDLNVHLVLLYAYSQLGRDADARREAAEVMKLSPHFSLEVKAQREGWFRPGAQHTLDVFRKAGLK